MFPSLRCPFFIRVLLLLAVAPAAGAAQVDVPIALDHRFIERVLRDTVFNGPDQSRRFNDDGSGCHFLELSRPRVSSEGALLKVLTDARARIGTAVGGSCLLATDWRGQFAILESATVENGSRLRLQMRHTRVLTPSGEPDPLATRIWQWSQPYVAPGLSGQVVDLRDTLLQLESFLGEVLVKPPGGAVSPPQVRVSGARVFAEGLRMTLQVQAPDATAPVSPEEPGLSAAELSALEERLQQVDVFFTRVIRQAAGATGQEPLRTAMMEVLLDTRYRLVDILADPRRTPVDPVRALFVDSWVQLAPLLRELSFGLDDRSDALAYLGFIAAGDALEALDRLGPAFGVDVSAAGLRRMARVLIRDGSEPLEYDEAVDPELRRQLGFGPPLSGAGAERHWLDWLVPPAMAAVDSAVVTKLNNWVPRTSDMDKYLPMVQKVLRHAVDQHLSEGKLEREYHEVFRRLVMTTAWQESCWRQFVNDKGKRMPLRSGSGDLGLMQINPRVWRGFYDLHKLKWDIAYNASSGTEVLLHYLTKYALRHGEHKKAGDVHVLARSAYSAYNGGPRAYDRYRRKDVPDKLQRIDRVFLEKYRVMKDDALVVKSCF